VTGINQFLAIVNMEEDKNIFFIEEWRQHLMSHNGHTVSVLGSNGDLHYSCMMYVNILCICTFSVWKQLHFRFLVSFMLHLFHILF